jgi:hypothetical protein
MARATRGKKEIDYEEVWRGGQCDDEFCDESAGEAMSRAGARRP